MTAAPDAPAALGDAGRALWGSITLWGSKDLDDLLLRPDDLAVLHEACATRDLIARLAEATKSAPVMMAGSRGQEVINPAIQELRQQRQLLASLLRQLGLPDYEDGEGWDGLTSSQRARKAAGKRWGR